MKQASSSTSLPKEELANVITHALGLLICLVASPVIIVASMKTAEWPIVLGVCIFCFSMIIVYAASTAYHAMINPRLKHIFRIIDHICIYLLIVGTHTPLLLLYLQNTFGYVVLTILWLLVLVGILYKTFWLGKLEWLSVSLYLAMGWSGVLTIPYMLEPISSTSIWWLAIGGISYTCLLYTSPSPRDS